MAPSEKPMPFIKHLASSDRKIRTEALTSLRSFLGARQRSPTPLTTLEILQLWKGLFYALWMADRPLPQQALAADLADLISLQPRTGVAAWLRGFYATMAREWTSIDVLRMEKFLLLVRRVLGASLAWMRGGDGDDDDGWAAADRERVDAVLGVLAEWPFLVGEEREEKDGDDDDEKKEDEESLMPRTVPVGLKVHVLDIWVDEAEKVGLLEDEDGAKEVLAQLNGLVEALSKGTTATAVRIRSREALEDERLPWNRKGADGIEGRAEGDDDEDMVADDGSWDGFND